MHHVKTEEHRNRILKNPSNATQADFDLGDILQAKERKAYLERTKADELRRKYAPTI